MREQIEERLAQLTSEFSAGQHLLTELEARQASVRDSLLRISGARQVLEELLAGQPVIAAVDGVDQNGRVPVETG